MNIGQIISNFFTYTEPRYLAGFLLQAGMILLAFMLIRRSKLTWKKLVCCVLVILLLRLVLFGQYLSWEVYARKLTVDDLGWRQQSVANVEYLKFFKASRRPKYLAVGSSQTYAIYLGYSEKNHDLGVFTLAGMGPLDLYLYRRYIAEKKPEYVLLYLSEFDLAKSPRMEGAKIAPFQGLSFLRIYPELRRIAVQGDADDRLSLKEMIVGQILPEYRYSFIFKGALDKLTGKREAMHSHSLYEQLNPNPLELLEHAKGLEDDMDEKWIEYNLYFLKEFLIYCKAEGLKVVMVEGQYNPVAVNEKTAFLNDFVRQELEGLDEAFGHVVFLPRAGIMEFGQDDYGDVMHVNPEAGYRFAQELVGKLESIKFD